MDRVVIHWDNDFIFENWESHRNWLSLCNSYNDVHDTSIGYHTFKSHCYRLGLNFHYTNEEVEWLKNNYPSLGRDETARLFRKNFKNNRTTGAIFVKCKTLGLKVTEERRRERAKQNTKRVTPVGAYVTREHGEKYIKTAHGFKRVKELVYGDVPKGMSLVYLDGNKDNITKENLCPVSRKTLAKMTINNFWSDNGVITKTGIMCCELEELIEY